MSITVIKIGGHEIADETFLTQLAETLAKKRAEKFIIVHGGGAEISNLQRQLNIEPHYQNGIRVTDGESLKVVAMVLAGLVNKRLVSYLLTAGVDAVGLTGVDRGMVKAKQMAGMEFTGKVSSTTGDWLIELVNQGIVPVVAPLCYAEDQPNAIYNVNADHVAGAIGGAVHAEKVVFITNVQGVMADGEVLPTLSTSQSQSLIETGVIFGGMIPKVTTALDVLEHGVPSSIITNLNGLLNDNGTTFKKG
jgi:acetylglutamate kinase